MTSENSENGDEPRFDNLSELTATLLDLPEKQKKALRLQLEGSHTTKEICEEVEIDESTFWRWRNKSTAYRCVLRSVRAFRSARQRDR